MSRLDRVYRVDNISHLVLVKLAVNGRGEDVSDDRTTVVDVTFGCKEALVFLMTDVMLILIELDDNTTVLEDRIKELDSVMLELFRIGGTEELGLITDLSVLLNGGTTVLDIGTAPLNDETTVLNVGILLSVGTEVLDDVSIGVTDVWSSAVVLFN